MGSDFEAVKRSALADMEANPMTATDAIPSEAALEQLVEEIQRGDQSPEYYAAAIQAVIDDAAKADWGKHGAAELALGQWQARALAA